MIKDLVFPKEDASGENVAHDGLCVSFTSEASFPKGRNHNHAMFLVYVYTCTQQEAVILAITISINATCPPLLAADWVLLDPTRV
jgi:hypothetical protein